MINRLKYIILLIILAIAVCSIGYGQNVYTLIKTSDKTIIKFKENWYFNKIKIPAHSFKLWGDHLTHNIILLELNKEKHLLSLSNSDSEFLEYSDLTQAIDSISVSSISISNYSVKEQLPQFSATELKTKQIEDNLLLVIENEKNSIIQNKCFSCHTLIPTALLIQTAESQRYKLDKSAVNNLFIEISSLANEDGSYFFSQQPCYGKNTTTLSAAYVLALLSDFMPTTFLKSGEKIKRFLTKTAEKDKLIQADFIFEPFYDSNTTPLLHEIIFLKNMYLKDPLNNKNCNERAMTLIKSIEKNKLSFQQKLILLCGMPYSYQFTPQEKQENIALLKNSLLNSKSKTSEKIRIISLYVYNKIASDIPYSQSNLNEINNMSQIIWNCMEKVLYNTPKYLNGSYDDK